MSRIRARSRKKLGITTEEIVTDFTQDTKSKANFLADEFSIGDFIDVAAIVESGYENNNKYLYRLVLPKPMGGYYVGNTRLFVGQQHVDNSDEFEYSPVRYLKTTDSIKVARVRFQESENELLALFSDIKDSLYKELVKEKEEVK